MDTKYWRVRGGGQEMLVFYRDLIFEGEQFLLIDDILLVVLRNISIPYRFY